MEGLVGCTLNLGGGRDGAGAALGLGLLGGEDVRGGEGVRGGSDGVRITGISPRFSLHLRHWQRGYLRYCGMGDIPWTRGERHNHQRRGSGSQPRMPSGCWWGAMDVHSRCVQNSLRSGGFCSTTKCLARALGACLLQQFGLRRDAVASCLASKSDAASDTAPAH